MFKEGDRVTVRNPKSPYNGKTGRVTNLDHRKNWNMTLVTVKFEDGSRIFSDGILEKAEQKASPAPAS